MKREGGMIFLITYINLSLIALQTSGTADNLKGFNIPSFFLGETRKVFCSLKYLYSS